MIFLPEAFSVVKETAKRFVNIRKLITVNSYQLLIVNFQEQKSYVKP